VPSPHLRADLDAEQVRAALQQIRVELDVPGPHPPEALAEAEEAARSWSREGREDRTEIPFVTIDPPESRDLDQALHLSRRKGGGYRVHYAIADLGAFVTPGGALDRAVHERGVTFYSPDERANLHPPVLGEGAASLLPDEDRPSVLWTIDLDADGAPVDTTVARAIVRSRAKRSYAEVQAELDAGGAPEATVLLAEVGRLRLLHEQARGGVSLELPSQEVAADDGTYALRYEQALLVEDWNAQISLLTGMEAARISLEAGAGVLRTLPPPEQGTLDAIRRSARALHAPWPRITSYPDFVRSIDAGQRTGAALLTQVARAFRGAGYATFHGAPPEQPLHAAVAAPYAHVTAPLRRLVDRYATECVLAAVADVPVPEWVLAALPTLPDEVQSATNRERSLQRAIVDLMEALVLQHRVGEVFTASVTSRDERGSTIQLADPAVLARIKGADLEPGTPVDVRLEAADPDERRVVFAPV
jgi:exoribonuclease R